MRKGELEVRRGVTLAPRGGARRGAADHYLLPRTAAEAARAVLHARELSPPGAPGGLTLAGAERSFEGHFVPGAAAAPRVVLSSKKLRGDVRVLGATTTRRGEPAVAVRALAGTSFGELVRAVRHAGFDAMPFSCPSAEAISLGGALAVNTHGRTSATYGGLFAEHVRRFTLLGADGRAYDCRADAESELERRLFRYVPGALGALGCVTELELELAHVARETRVVTEVLDRRRADPVASVASYLDRIEHDARAHTFSEGFGLVFFGAPGRGPGVVLGRRRAAGSEPKGGTLPLFRENRALNLLVHGLYHRFPGVTRELAARLLAPGKSFSAPYERWAFFLSSYDEAALRLERRAAGARAGKTRGLGLVHQGWVVTSGALPAFVALASELFAQPEFEPVTGALEYLDLLPLPAPATPLDPSRAARREPPSSAADSTHVVSLSVAVREPALRERAEALCRSLSARAFERKLEAVVQLNKQHHVEPAVLRAMYRTPLAELAALKSEVDPDALIGSRSLERLGVSATGGAPAR
jgi:FAD/FMN-containing dehydrogenase